MMLAEFVAARLTEHWEYAQVRYASTRWDAANPAYDRDRFRAEEAKKAAEREIRVVEAQRDTLARHEGCGRGWGYCEGDRPGRAALYAGRGCPDLLDLAQPDREHPDFNLAWQIEVTQ